MIKTIMLLAFIHLIAANADAQNIGDPVGAIETTLSKDPKHIYTEVEVQAEPVNGITAFLNDYIKKNLISAENKNPDARILIDFIVEKNGLLNTFKVLRSNSPNLDSKVIQLFQKAPAWKPALIGGKPVRSKYTIVVNVGS